MSHCRDIIFSFLLTESLASSFSSKLSFLSLFSSFDSSYTDSISIQGFITLSHHWSGIRSQIVDPIFLIAQFFIRSFQSRSFDSTLIPPWEFAIAYKIKIPLLIHSRKAFIDPFWYILYLTLHLTLLCSTLKAQICYLIFLPFASDVEVRVPEWLKARKMEWANRVHIPIATVYAQLALRNINPFFSTCLQLWIKIAGQNEFSCVGW